MSASDPAAYWFPRVMRVPLMSFLGARPVDPADPTAGLLLEVRQEALNAADVTHGGVLGSILDLAAYLAVLPSLGPGEQAATHHFSATYMLPTRAGDRLHASGVLLRRARHVAFTEAIVRCLDSVIARASVTKSIIHGESEAAGSDARAASAIGPIGEGRAHE